MSGHPRCRVAAALAAVVALGAYGLVVPAASSAAPDSLGLPDLASAQRYNLAPASRTVPARAVGEAWATNSDYVTAAQPVSEIDAHDLQSSPGSSTATVDGVSVRLAGAEAPGAWFSYRLQAPAGGGLTLRVEEAGSATAAYDVLVNGTRVYQRGPDRAQTGVWHDLVGLVHYQVAVPKRVAGSGPLTVTFRNAATPGAGARIAGVWALTQRRADPGAGPYGASVADPDAARGDGTTTLRSNIFGRPYVVYDFGREVGGTVELTATATEGTPRLALAFSESPQYMTTSSDFSQDPPGVATETHQFPLHAGRQSVQDPVIRGGFRYLMVFLDAPGTVQVSGLRLHFSADPTNTNLRGYRGAFLSSDASLNRLWYSGAYTVQMATIDPHTGRPYPAQPGPVRNDATIGDGHTVISDGAKRDRMIWGGDNAVSTAVSLLSTGQSAPARNAIAFMAKGQFANGEVPGVYLPGGAGYQAAWGEYAAWWIDNYWTYYLYTGDRAFLDRYWPTLQKDVAWFETFVGSDGLLDVPGGASGHWGYGNSGKETYDNALYVHALDLAAQAAQVASPSDAATYRAHGQRTADAINAALWDAHTGAYIEKPGSSAHPQDANAMAVLAGVATGARADAVLRFFHGALATPVGDLTNDVGGDTVPRYVSPFVTAQELRAYATTGTHGADRAALSLLHRTWDHMLGSGFPGTFWETVSPSGGLQLGSYTSLSHGWSAAPTSYLSNYLLGVTPTSGGFATFDVRPHPGGGPRWAEGTVPTPQGPITVRWKQDPHSFILSVSAPKGTSAAVALPAAGVTALTRDGRDVPVPHAHGGVLRIGGVTGTTTLRSSLG